ncbi:MAG: entericidin EcnA/B family protein [Rhodospirillales bacterium]|nr:entericidin EcnA/B family protein [Rhodospirillales bacterium]
MRRSVIVLLSLALLSLGACNTAEGMGQDLSAAGRGITGMFGGSDQPTEQPKR